MGARSALVLDLDHTLVECCLHDASLGLADVSDLTSFGLEIKRGAVTLMEQYLLKIRPGAPRFLARLCQDWAVTIYTKG
jgi:hypothetical protein